MAFVELKQNIISVSTQSEQKDFNLLTQHAMMTIIPYSFFQGVQIFMKSL